MKQELVRTKSKISSLKREMSSIQQLHLAQQHAQAQLSVSAINPTRQELEQYQSYQTVTYNSPSQTDDSEIADNHTTDNLESHNDSTHCHDPSTRTNDEPLSVPNMPNNPTFVVQSTQTSSPLSLVNTLPDLNDQQSQTTNSLSNDLLSKKTDPPSSASDEQLRLYLTETIQREKDSAV